MPLPAPSGSKASDTRPAEAPPPAPSPETPEAAAAPPARRRPWRLVLGILAALVLLFLIVPRVLHALRTESTDDAYVNRYVTFVAPRVTGQVASVLVDDNNRVKKDDVLVQLDPEPFRVQVAIRQAALHSARADLAVANANVRAQVGLIRSNRYKLVNAVENVDDQIAVIRTRAANWEQSKATLVLAQAEFDRAQRLLAGKVVSSEEDDQKKATLDVSRAQVTQAQAPFVQANGDPVAAAQMAWQSLENLREQQASALAYFDAFLLFAVVGGLLAFPVLFRKRSVVEKGTHIAAD